MKKLLPSIISFLIWFLIWFFSYIPIALSNGDAVLIDRTEVTYTVYAGIPED